MHHHRQRTYGDDFGVVDLEVYRHCFLKLRVRPAARAKTVLPADHDQAATQFLRVANKDIDLLVTEVGLYVDSAAAARNIS